MSPNRLKSLDRVSGTWYYSDADSSKFLTVPSDQSNIVLGPQSPAGTTKTSQTWHWLQRNESHFRTWAVNSIPCGKHRWACLWGALWYQGSRLSPPYHRWSCNKLHTKWASCIWSKWATYGGAANVFETEMGEPVLTHGTEVHARSPILHGLAQIICVNHIWMDVGQIYCCLDVCKEVSWENKSRARIGSCVWL